MRGPFQAALIAARTARHLRARQLVYWPLRRVQHWLPAPRRPRDSATPSAHVGALAAVVASWGPGDAPMRVARADAVCAGRFRFLNHDERLEPIDWNRHYVSHLWTYNLHYFDYALDLAWAARVTDNSGYARRFGELADSWTRGTTWARGVGWEPYAVSVRAVNWSYALLLIGDRLAAATRDRLWASLHEQLAFLARRLEVHLLANHYQRNLRALHLGGLLFAGPRAAAWRRAADVMWVELLEQFLTDGVHAERSPMYHAIALGDYLEALALARAAGAEPREVGVITRRLDLACDALARLSRPDGTLHNFNDSAHGVAPPAERLDALARSVLGRVLRRETDDPGPWRLPHGGFAGWCLTAAGERFVMDCGEMGPSHQPGHGHCGLLGFELDFGGRPAIVDTGVRGYGGDALRAHVRSTRAHNTLVIGGREQSEIWGVFRVARRARLRGTAVATADAESAARFEAAYRPYWSAAVTHRRTVRRERDSNGAWVIDDTVVGATGEPIASLIHLHPSLSVSEASTRRIVATYPDGATVVIAPVGVDSLCTWRGSESPPQGWWCPEFGVALPATAIELQVAANDGRRFGYSIRYVPNQHDRPGRPPDRHAFTAE